MKAPAVPRPAVATLSVSRALPRITARARRLAGAMLLALGAAATANAGTLVLRVGSALPADSPVGHLLRAVLAPAVDARTGGSAGVEIALAGTSCSELTCIEAMRLGDLDIATVSAANYGGLGASFEILTLPYLFSGVEAAQRFFDSALHVELRARAERDERLAILGIVPTLGFRALEMRVAGVLVPADLRGRTVRVTASPLDATLLSGWGAIPLPVEWHETGAALASGIVDGLYVQIGMYRAMGFQRHARYVTVTGGSFAPMLILMDASRFAALPGDVRAALHAARDLMAERAFAVDAEYTERALSGVGDEDMRIQHLDAAQARQWQDAAVAAWVHARQWQLYDPVLAREILHAQPGRSGFIATLEAAGAL